MATAEDPDLLSIEIDADNYAGTAAGDVRSTVSRTHQSEAAFQAQKAAYTAKFDDGESLDRLCDAVPELRDCPHNNKNITVVAGGLESGSATESDSARGTVNVKESKRKLSKREVQLLGYAVAELYADRKYGEVRALCECVAERCEVDPKTEAALERWRGRAGGRMREDSGDGREREGEN